MKILEIKTEKRALGDFGEKAALKHLKRNKYKILETNYVGKDSEIDIIAENKETVAFVEVKTRIVSSVQSYESRPAAAVTPDKQKKIISAAKYFIGRKAIDKQLRLDVIEVYASKTDSGYKIEKILHIENAFNINTAYERYKKGYR